MCLVTSLISVLLLYVTRIHVQADMGDSMGEGDTEKVVAGIRVPGSQH